jgi:hypothetical protein
MHSLNSNAWQTKHAWNTILVFPKVLSKKKFAESRTDSFCVAVFLVSAQVLTSAARQ